LEFSRLLARCSGEVAVNVCSVLLNWLFLRFLACDGLLAAVLGCMAKPHNPTIRFLIYAACPAKTRISRPNLATPQ